MWENFINIFPGLSRTNKQNSRTFQDSKKNQGLSRTFPGCGNPGVGIICWSVITRTKSHLALLQKVWISLSLPIQSCKIFLPFLMILWRLIEWNYEIANRSERHWPNEIRPAPTTGKNESKMKWRWITINFLSPAVQAYVIGSGKRKIFHWASDFTRCK